MPVGQLIDFSAELCGTDPQRIHDIAKRLGLDIDAILTRQFVRLSGGMKQKLLIAIAPGPGSATRAPAQRAVRRAAAARRVRACARRTSGDHLRR